MVQTKFVKYKPLNYFKSITLILSIAKNCILELANQRKFVKYRALENNQLYGSNSACNLGYIVYIILGGGRGQHKKVVA